MKATCPPCSGPETQDIWIRLHDRTAQRGERDKRIVLRVDNNVVAIGNNSGNSRNRNSAKTLKGSFGTMPLEVPRRANGERSILEL